MVGETSMECEHLVQCLSLLESFMNAHCYPASAKYFLKRYGLPLSTACRWEATTDFDVSHQQAMDAVLNQLDSFFVPQGEWLSLRMSNEDWPSLREWIEWPEAAIPILD